MSREGGGGGGGGVDGGEGRGRGVRGPRRSEKKTKKNKKKRHYQLFAAGPRSWRGDWNYLMAAHRPKWLGVTTYNPWTYICRSYIYRSMV